MKNNRTVLIADSGSTKTDWLLMSSGESLAQFQSAGMNPFYQSREEIATVLENEVLPKLPINAQEIFFYGAGCADELTGKPIRDALGKAIQSAFQIQVASDMLGAARALCGTEPGIACILGTGANNAFYDGRDIVRSIGSLGFWLGDEGSGSYLGKTLVVHFLQNELPPDLHALFAQAYPSVKRLSVLEHAYRKPFPNRYFASFSEFLIDNLRHPFIQNLASTAFDLFVKKYILKHEDVEKYPVHFTGSIAFYYQAILKGSLTRHGILAGRILKSPLTGLADYHQQIAEA